MIRPFQLVGQASDQCHLVLAETANSAEVVGRTPRSGCPLGQDAPVPHPAQRRQHPAKREQADGASAADQGVRPTIKADGPLPASNMRPTHCAGSGFS
jgi:hypothetical protein